MGRGFGNRNNDEHWAREIFRKWQIPLHALSRRLNDSSPYLSAVLTGSIVPSDYLNTKIEGFAFQVIENAKKKNY